MEAAPHEDAATEAKERIRNTGTWLPLAGAIVYFLEWAVIIPAGGAGPASLGTKPAAIVALYAQHTDMQELMAGWFSLVLLGRIAFVAGVRGALRLAPRELPYTDLALGAMTVSVALEVAAYGVAAGAGWLAAHGGSTAAVVALDAGANWLDQIIFAPVGVAVAALSFAMLRSRLFPGWMCWLGLVAGVLGMGSGALAGPGFVATGAARAIWGVANTLGVVGFWIWMLATGILLARRTRRV